MLAVRFVHLIIPNFFAPISEFLRAPFRTRAMRIRQLTEAMLWNVFSEALYGAHDQSNVVLGAAGICASVAVYVPPD
jgi:hypothetical protein